jgi:NAD(P)-dependent dehydrogenase (short-subunit alcohol dehydrogenase family)
MNKIVMVTGASGGLGQIAGRMMMENGWQVAQVTRDAGRMNSSQEEIGEIIEADVSTSEGSKIAIDLIKQRLGESPSALLNCAGSVLIAPMHRTKADQYRECLQANLDSAFFSLSAFVAALIKEKQSGAAVLVSTVAARIGVANHEAIAAAKGAIEALVRSASATYSSKGIRFNAIAPGLMKSPATTRFFLNDKVEQQIASQYPLGRYGNLKDAASAAVWLLNDEQAGWITGQVLAVDGGYSSVRPMLRR